MTKLELKQLIKTVIEESKQSKVVEESNEKLDSMINTAANAVSSLLNYIEELSENAEFDEYEYVDKSGVLGSAMESLVHYFGGSINW